MSLGEYWRYIVLGRLVRENELSPVNDVELICESGTREKNSCFSLISVGPPARTDRQGRFIARFSTSGSQSEMKAPNFVSLNIRVARGSWKEYIVPLKAATLTDALEMELSLGSVVIEADQGVYRGET